MSDHEDTTFFDRLLDQARSLLDLDTEFRYEHDILPEALRRRYDRGDVVRALVDARPNAIWSGRNELTLDGSPSADLNAIARRYRLWEAFFRANLMAEITGYSVIVLPGLDTQQAPTPEEAETFRLAVYGAEAITFQDEDVGADGLPRLYRRPGQLRYIDGSRCLHVSDARYSTSPLVGNPRLRSAWNRITDWQKILGGGSEAFLQAALPGVHLSYNQMPGEAEKKDLRERMVRFLRGRLRWLATSSTKFERVAPTPVDFSTNGTFMLTVLASSFMVPLTEVTGEALVAHSAGVARASFRDSVDEDRYQWVEPRLVAPGVTWFESIRMGFGGQRTFEDEARVGVRWSPWNARGEDGGDNPPDDPGTTPQGAVA